MIKNITIVLIIASIFYQGYCTSVVALPASSYKITLPASGEEVLQDNPDQEVVTVTQTMPSSVIAGTEFTVELTLSKGNITSFAKVQQELPSGFTATAIETQQANFSFNNHVVKFIWKSLPEKNEFQLSYKVLVSANEVPGTKAIGGIFAYLENNERRIVDIPPNDIVIHSPVEASIEPSETPSPDDITETTEVPLTDETVFEDKKTTESTEPETPDTRDEILVHEDTYGEEPGNPVEEIVELTEKTIESSTGPSSLISDETKSEEEPMHEKAPNPAPTNITPPAKFSIEYRVQIAAAYKKISTTYFLNKYNITERIDHEVHDEMNKYTVGSFSNYKTSIEHVNFIRNNKGVEGAFITAYENGKRITVREAFEIRRQNRNK